MNESNVKQSKLFYCAYFWHSENLSFSISLFALLSRKFVRAFLYFVLIQSTRDKLNKFNFGPMTATKSAPRHGNAGLRFNWRVGVVTEPMPRLCR